MREIRNNSNELNVNLDSRTVEGYAIVFNKESRDLGGFTEVISPSAIDGILDKSDVLCLLNHNEDRGVLARSKFGEGSLELTVDEIGLKYRFEAPNTALGDELLEGLKRGDISTSSFAFTIDKDNWEKSERGYKRTITQFKELFDVSPVYKEAYPDTTVALRKMQEINTEDLKEVEPIENPADNNTNTQTKQEIKMEKFSLLRAINDVANNRQIDETAQEVVAKGIAEMRKAGQSYAGQIVLPMESRSIQATVEGAGIENVAEDKLGILEPLRSNLVLVQAGASYMTGLVGNISIPTYSGSNVGWAGEISTASDGKGSFAEVNLEPKRLTAYLDISKQFLIQDSNSAEAMLKADIVRAISNKLEATVLGDEAGSTTKPKGLLNGVTADTAAITYKNVVAMEAELESKNVGGDIKFIVSPSAKADLKTTLKASGVSGYLMEGNEVNGYEVLSTSAVAGKGVIMGNFSDYVVAQWGGIDLTVDPFTQAAEGKVRLVINAYFDAKPRREEAFVKRVLKA